jgi:hypothetical protein
MELPGELSPGRLPLLPRLNAGLFFCDATNSAVRRSLGGLPDAGAPFGDPLPSSDEASPVQRGPT